MPRAHLTQKRALTAVIFLLILFCFLPSNFVRAIADPPRDVVNAVVSPFAHPLKSLGDVVRRPEQAEIDLGQQAEYERAKQRNVQLQLQLDAARKQIAALTQVRQQIEMTGVRLQSARVTSWSGRQHVPTLAINRGERQGVLVGHVVASGFNLVGKVVDTAPLNATVQLITSPGRPLAGRFVAPAMDAEAPPDATAGAALEPQTRGGRRVFEAVVPAGSVVEPGYLAHLSDESWAPEARGFVIGKVVKIEPYPEDPTLRKLVTVEPVESLPHVSQVVVLIPTAGDG